MSAARGRTPSSSRPVRGTDSEAQHTGKPIRSIRFAIPTWVFLGPPRPVYARSTIRLADPNDGFAFSGGIVVTLPIPTDGDVRSAAIMSRMPAMFTNGAGYTVSQGYGVYREQIGYGHGVVDAGLAVMMAQQWHYLGQNMDPFTEQTFTTLPSQFRSQLGLGPSGRREDGRDRLQLHRAGRHRRAGWLHRLLERIFRGRRSGQSRRRPVRRRSASQHRGYPISTLPCHRASDQRRMGRGRKSISTGSAEDLDYLRIMLTSPDGHAERAEPFLRPIRSFGSPLSFQRLASP